MFHAQAVKVLQRLIPSWRPLELDPCEECEGTLEQSVAEADKLKVQQGVDKVGARSDSAVDSRLAELTRMACRKTSSLSMTKDGLAQVVCR